MFNIIEQYCEKIKILSMNIMIKLCLLLHIHNDLFIASFFEVEISAIFGIQRQ